MNVANILTTIRMILIPYIVYLFFLDQIFMAGLVFVVAVLTDFFDGFIARKFNMITEFGKLFDPLADKAMMVAVLVCLTFRGLMPPIVTVLFTLKEACMFVGGVALYRHSIIIEAKWYGKTATVITVFCVLVLMLFTEMPYVIVFQYLPLICAFLTLFMYALDMRKNTKGVRTVENPRN